MKVNIAQRRKECSDNSAGDRDNSFSLVASRPGRGSHPGRADPYRTDHRVDSDHCMDVEGGFQPVLAGRGLACGSRFRANNRVVAPSSLGSVVQIHSLPIFSPPRC